MLKDRLLNWLEGDYLIREKGINYLKKFDAALGSTIGSVRSSNEDRAVIFKYSYRREIFTGALLCDGMGGMTAGEKSANLAVASFLDGFLKQNQYPLQKRIEEAVFCSNRDVKSFAKGKGGTTLVGIIVDQKRNAICFNVGDSRAYVYHNADKLKQITVDDTIDGQLAHLKNKIDPNVLKSNQLVQYIGMDAPPQVHFHNCQFDDEHKYAFLTSDGAHVIGEKIISDLCQYSNQVHDVVKKVLCISEWVGGKDNSTVIMFGNNPIMGNGVNDIYDIQLLEVAGINNRIEFVMDVPSSTSRKKNAYPENRKKNNSVVGKKQEKSKNKVANKNKASLMDSEDKMKDNASKDKRKESVEMIKVEIEEVDDIEDVQRDRNGQIQIKFTDG